jgi:hypothetical protein
MGARVSSTAFRLRLASLLWQRAGPCRRNAVTFVPAFLLALILPGCASVDVLMLSSETFTSQASQVEILERAPTRPYVPIAVLSVDSWWLSFDSKLEKILEKAATLGADAVVFGDLRLSPPNPGNRTAGQSTPPPSLPPEDIEKFMPNELHSSTQDDVLGADVRVLLVHGGGHGGGGGGHAHGGHWGSRSGHLGFRHGGRFYGPGYWGYGLYGSGWWGYGPYWGGYYPYYGYYGSYPYPGYGYMNTVTVGTAIHYTD